MLKSILITILSIIIPIKEPIYAKTYLIQRDIVPLNIYWISEQDILISNISNPYILNLDTREKEHITVDSNTMVGYEDGLIYCRYTHYNIYSMDEYSTKIEVLDTDMNILNTFSIFPTVIPTKCTREYVILKNAYSFLESKMYIYSIKDSKLEEYIPKEIPNSIFNITDYKNVSISKRYIIVLDMFNSLWLYQSTL